MRPGDHRFSIPALFGRLVSSGPFRRAARSCTGHRDGLWSGNREGDNNADARQAPDKAGLVLLSLILVAAVANLNLSVANVALPDIGAAFSASQTALDLVAVGYSLGLAASVLWLGALGDRYGR